MVAAGAPGRPRARDRSETVRLATLVQAINSTACQSASMAPALYTALPAKRTWIVATRWRRLLLQPPPAPPRPLLDAASLHRVSARTGAGTGAGTGSGYVYDGYSVVCSSDDQRQTLFQAVKGLFRERQPLD